MTRPGANFHIYSLAQRRFPFMTMLMTLSWRTFIILAVERTRCCLHSSEIAGWTDSVVANLQLLALENHEKD